MARFNLPDIQFVTLDAVQIETEMVDRYFELTGQTLTEADPRRKLIQTFTYALTLFLNNVEYSMKQKLLSYSTDDFLDHLAQDDNITRLEPTSAKMTARFELEIPDGETLLIPAGTRLAATSDIVFQTQEDVSVPSGTTFQDIEMVCTTTGTVGNNFLPKQIYQTVDSYPWISQAYNITTSEGGTDWEDNDTFAERIRLSKEGFSTAGPEQAYIYHAKSANKLISDISVQVPSAGTVQVTVLLENGGIPDTTTLQEVRDYLNDKSIRPLTDLVTTAAPQVVEYDIDATYYIHTDFESLVTSVQADVEAAKQDYLTWQKSKLGRSIDLGELQVLLRKAGAARVVIHSPVTFQELSRQQVAKERNVTLQYGGIIYV